MKPFLICFLFLVLVPVVTPRAQDVRMNQQDNNSASRANYTTQSETNHYVTSNAIVAAWNDSHQASTLGTQWNSLMSWGYSANGTTFTDAGLFTVSNQIVFGDPAVVADSTGYFYVASLLGSSQYSIDGLAIARTTNNTPPITLGTPVKLSPMTSGDEFDKELMAIDRSGGKYDGRVYVAMSEGDFWSPAKVKVVVAHSTGTSPLTFSSWQALTAADVLNHGAMPAVGPGGEVYVVWGRFAEDSSGNFTGETIQLVKSADGGATFVNPDSSDPAKAKNVATPVLGPDNLGSGSNMVRTRGYPYIAVDSSPTGSPTRGSVYVIYQAKRDASSTDAVDIFFTRSTDGGVHWSTPRNINSSPAVTTGADSTTHDNWMPSIAVSPVNGHIYVSFFDRRDDAGNLVTRVYRALSTDGGLTWDNAQLSSATFTPSTGYDPILVNTYFGDYNWVFADSNGVHFTWGDSRNLCSPPTGAANPCSPKGRGDQDVYYHHVANLTGADLFIQPWGAVTGIGPLWETPDIYVVDGMGNQINAEKNVINKLRAHVRNIGNAAANGVVVRFKYVPAAAGFSYFKEIGTVTQTFSAMGGGSDSAVIPIDWDLTNLNETNGGKWPQPISAYDHFCVQVNVEYGADINQSNNMAQTNFFDVGTAQGTAATNLLIGNPTKKKALAKVLVDKLPQGYSAVLRVRGVDNPAKGFVMEPGEVRVATVTFGAPKLAIGAPPQEVIANITVSLDGELVGGISARLSKGPREPNLSGLHPATGPIEVPPPRRLEPSGKQAPQQKVEEQPLRTIPAAVSVRSAFKQDYATVYKGILGLLEGRKLKVALADENRGLINTVRVNVKADELVTLIEPEFKKYVGKDGGDYWLSFWLRPTEGGAEVGVDSMITVSSTLDAPVGKRLKSNGRLEHQFLEELSKRLR
jgi:hypothetical protein